MNDEAKVWIRKRKRKKGMSYDIRWIDPSTGEWRSKSAGKDRQRANYDAAILRKRLNEGTYRDVKQISWVAFAKEHLQTLSGVLAVGTVKLHRNTLDAFASVCTHSLRVNRINFAMVERFRSYLIDKKLSPATVNSYLRTLSSILGRAVERDYLAINPIIGKRRKLFITEPEPEPIVVPPEDFEKLLHACRDTRWQAFTSVAYHCGLRKGELENLEWTDVDFYRLIISVENKEDHQTKNRKRREVPMNDDVVTILQKLWSERYVSRWVFTSRALDGRRMHNNTCKRFEEIVRRAKLVDHANQPKYSLHDLRSSFVTRMLESGANPKRVQRFCGHSSLSTTMKHYAGDEQWSDRDAVQKIAIGQSAGAATFLPF